MGIQPWRRHWFLRKRALRRSLRGTPVHTIMGRHTFHPRVWRSDRRSIAGGVALGLFTAFTPTIPFQMLLAAIGAILFQVNLPIALAACWVTNPLTAVPIYVAARRLGKTMLTHHESVDGFISLFAPEGHMGRWIREGIYLTGGSLVFAALAAVGGYLAVLALWKIIAHTQPLRRHRRSMPSCPADSGRNGAGAGKGGDSRIPAEYNAAMRDKKHGRERS